MVQHGHCGAERLASSHILDLAAAPRLRFDSFHRSPLRGGKTRAESANGGVETIYSQYYKWCRMYFAMFFVVLFGGLRNCMIATTVFLVLLVCSAAMTLGAAGLGWQGLRRICGRTVSLTFPNTTLRAFDFPQRGPEVLTTEKGLKCTDLEHSHTFCC